MIPRRAPLPCAETPAPHRAWRLAPGLLLLLIMAAGPALANPSFQQGRKYLDLMEDSRALAKFEEALRWPENTPADRAKILMYIGITQCNLLDKKSAAESFRAALVEDPQVKLPRVTSPDITALFGRVQREARAAEPTAPPSRPDTAEDKEGHPRREGRDEGSSSTARGWATWTCLGLGVAAGAAGITLGVLARGENDKAQDLTLTTPAAQQHYDRAHDQAVAAYVLLGTAGAALITSAVLFYLGRSPARPVTLSLSPIQRGVSLGISGWSW